MQMLMIGNPASAYPIGQPITLVPDPGSGECSGPEAYPSRIEDVTDRTVVVSMPMRHRQLVVLPKDAPVSAYFNQRGTRYRFRGLVGSSTHSPFPLLHITRLGSVANVDRRAHARVETVIEPVKMSVVTEHGSTSITPSCALVVNVSAGGLGLICRTPIEPGSLVPIVVDLPGDFGRLEAEGLVVRAKPIGPEVLRKWQVGLSFRGLGPKDQDRVAAFVLYKQRMNRKKGLL